VISRGSDHGEDRFFQRLMTAGGRVGLPSLVGTSPGHGRGALAGAKVVVRGVRERAAGGHGHVRTDRPPAVHNELVDRAEAHCYPRRGFQLDEHVHDRLGPAVRRGSGAVHKHETWGAQWVVFAALATPLEAVRPLRWPAPIKRGPGSVRSPPAQALGLNFGTAPGPLGPLGPLFRNGDQPPPERRVPTACVGSGQGEFSRRATRASSWLGSLTEG
jgi:hypothetical protein